MKEIKGVEIIKEIPVYEEKIISKRNRKYFWGVSLYSIALIIFVIFPIMFWVCEIPIFHVFFMCGILAILFIAISFLGSKEKQIVLTNSIRYYKYQIKITEEANFLEVCKVYAFLKKENNEEYWDATPRGV
jgi:hypothetical protein